MAERESAPTVCCADTVRRASLGYAVQSALTAVRSYDGPWAEPLDFWAILGSHKPVWLMHVEFENFCLAVRVTAFEGIERRKEGGNGERSFSSAGDGGYRWIMLYRPTVHLVFCVGEPYLELVLIFLDIY